MMCGSPPLLVTDGATHVKNIAAGRIEQIIDEAIGPTIYQSAALKIQRRITATYKPSKNHMNIIIIWKRFVNIEKTIDWLNEAVVRSDLHDEEILMGRRVMISR